MAKNSKIKICTPIVGQTIAQFCRNLVRIQKKSNCVELRVDYIENLGIEDLDKLRAQSFRESILTCRSVSEGGKFQGKESKRKAILGQAIKLGFEHVDIELATMEKSDFQRRAGVKIIVSEHNFQKTPSFAGLQSILERIKKQKPDIIKIASKVNCPEDNRELLRLLLDQDKGDKMIVIGMGKKGLITRVASPLLGGYLTFAAVRGQKTASGQLDLDDLKRLYRALGFRF